MAVVTITEILGGDNIAASRVVINNNFTLLQNAVNTLETRLNTSYTPGGSLNVGSIQALKYTRPLTTNIFLVQASAQIDGNLSLGTATFNSTLSITGAISTSLGIGVGGSVQFTNTGGGLTFQNYLQTYTTSSISDAQWWDATTLSPLMDIQALSGAVPVTLDSSVIRLDASTYTSVKTLTMPAVTTATQGQIITLAFDKDYLCPSNQAYTIATANFDPAFAVAPIALNASLASNNVKFGGIWITLVAANNGWRVIGAHNDVTYM